MGREASITIEQVHAVADAIKAEGGKPTLRSVRERLGAGSMGTVSKYLQQWKAGQERHSNAELVLPAALQRTILDFMAMELAAARAPLEAELVDQQQTTSDLATENERQGSIIDSQQAEIETLLNEKAAAEGKAEQLGIDLITMKDETKREREAAEQARTELAKAMLRLEAMPRLEADLASTRADLGNERQARIEAEQQAAVLSAQKIDLENRLVEIMEAMPKLETDLLSVRAELDTERKSKVAAEQQSAVLSAQKIDLENRLLDGKNELAIHKDQYDKIHQRMEELAIKLADSRVLTQTQQGRIDDLTIQLERVRTEAKEAAGEAAVLTSQNVGLTERVNELTNELAETRNLNSL